MNKLRWNGRLLLVLMVSGCNSEGQDVESSRSARSFATISPTSVYQIKNAATGKCIGIAGNSKSNDAHVEERTCNGSVGQNFSIASVATGYYAIKNTNSAKCLDVTGKSTRDGAAIIQYTCSSIATNQQWAIADTSGGAVRLTAHHSSKVAGINGGATADGTLVVQETWSGATYQQFMLSTGAGGAGGSGGTTGTGGSGGSGGSSGTCLAGAACPLANPCQIGTISCSTGSPVCVLAGNQAPGVLCGAPASCNPSTNVATPAQMCDGIGNCPAVTPVMCLSGCNGTVCAATKSDGTVCSSGTECAHGNCVSNAAGTGKICCASPCSNACQACASNGSACTTKNAGVADAVCGGATTCHTGTCASGGICQLASPGTACAGGLYCTTAGQCTCQGGGSCQPSNVCQTGTYSCTTGTAQCTVSGNQPTTVACGAQQSCSGTTKKLAQMCNGNGSCASQMTQKCLYRCNAQGTDCDNTNYCSPNPCLNGGSCTNTTTGYTCACTGGWGGATCTVNLFQGLGMLSSEYSDSSNADAVSADGSIVVGEAYGTFRSVSQGFKWTSSGGMVSLTSPVPNYDFIATAISANGIAGMTQFCIPLGLYWNGSAEYNLNDFGGNGSGAYGLSDNGVVVGFGYTNTGAYRAVRWASVGAPPIALDAAGTYAFSIAYGVSSDGTVVVGVMSNGAFRWTTTGGLVPLPGATPQARAVNSTGAITVGWVGAYPNLSPVKWSGTSSPVTLGSGDGQALAVNSAGTVIVGTSSAGAFVWDSASGRRLIATVLANAGANLAGWSLTSAKGVSADGKTIVGDGAHNGTVEAWIARLP
jgi:uncharacterized membrane protein